MSRQKGNDRENQARKLYERAGFAVEKAVPERYGRSDWFGYWDFMAVRQDSIRFVQVKGGSASGIYEAAEWAAAYAPPCLECEYAIYYKNEGWRIVRVLPEDKTYTTVYDERKDGAVSPHHDDKDNMGDGVVEFLALGD